MRPLWRLTVFGIVTTVLRAVAMSRSLWIVDGLRRVLAVEI
jgi:hypothetical protein